MGHHHCDDTKKLKRQCVSCTLCPQPSWAGPQVLYQNSCLSGLEGPGCLNQLLCAVTLCFSVHAKEPAFLFSYRKLATHWGVLNTPAAVSTHG